VPRFLLSHRHAAAECRVAFAAWKGVESPLRRRDALGTCGFGGHQLWWTVEASDTAAALALLPPFLATRTEALEVSDVPIP
jgi:hypothetical protein